MGLRAQDAVKIMEAIPGIKELGQLTLAGTGGLAAGAGIGLVTDVPTGDTLSQHLTDSAIRGGYTGLGGAAGSSAFKLLAKKISSKPGLIRNILREDAARLGGTTAGAATGYHLGTNKIDKRHAKRQARDKNLSELQVSEGSDMDNKEASKWSNNMSTLEKEAKLLFLQNRQSLLQKMADDEAKEEPKEEKPEADTSEAPEAKPEKVQASASSKRKHDAGYGAAGLAVGVPAGIAGGAALGAGAVGAKPAYQGAKAVGGAVKGVYNKLPGAAKTGIKVGGIGGAGITGAILTYALLKGRQRAQQSAEQAAAPEMV